MMLKNKSLIIKFIAFFTLGFFLKMSVIYLWPLPANFHRNQIAIPKGNYRGRLVPADYLPEKPLKKLAQEKGIFVGSAVDTEVLQGEKNYQNILKREFNLITPENALKFAAIEPEKDKFNFEKADQLVAWAGKNQLALRGHTLIWGNSLPNWLKEGNFDREEVIEIMKNHIETLVGRYEGKIEYWDVVNEALDDDGNLKENFWLEKIGPEYIELAFKFAHEADPNTQLFYNDYGIETKNKKSEAVFDLIKKLEEKGAPIDGIGFQSHFNLKDKIDYQSISENFDRFSETGLIIHITEANFSTQNLDLSEIKKEEKQAQGYANLLSICLNKKACQAFVMWGFTDKYFWQNLENSDDPKNPLIFDENYRPKLAYLYLNYLLANFPLLP